MLSDEMFLVIMVKDTTMAGDDSRDVGVAAGNLKAKGDCETEGRRVASVWLFAHSEQLGAWTSLKYRPGRTVGFKIESQIANGPGWQCSVLQ